ncbi:CDP-diacylglycerol--serine O-phosphatidyltransferase [Kutzneria sp. CA-103260]|uniref:CDP-diacylglycerol--serine O-phosphatidyltransferase n=1 Tax=Kutzneria sp. CA-103260 TaxID=2802641 RepID=UPI001BAD12CF|nr:CDP-diacylglycerol--serine O-phosphatidyltransferase [Kutzneria sp. CA-103260]QUQ69535.1 phosphatidylserine synthase [Kutzneria sp. CA-103260]
MPSGPGVRLLPNAITVLAMCAGLSGVQFALTNNYEVAIGAIGAAAILDSLDGRIARLLDATSKMGAELDSLADAISFGVAPALMLYIWNHGSDNGLWIVSLIFAACMVLRLARFNTLLEDTEKPPFTKEFFVGVPAPPGALLALLPMVLWLAAGTGWWTSPILVAAWTVFVAALMISRVPTLSLKTIKVPPRLVAPLLVGVVLVAATVLLYPLWALVAAMLIYLGHIPYAVYRYYWLARHPEAWSVPSRERRAIRRAGSAARRFGLRPPLRRRVAGAASRISQVRLPRRGEPTSNGNGSGDGRRRGWRQLGLRRQERR